MQLYERFIPVFTTVATQTQQFSLLQGFPCHFYPKAASVSKSYLVNLVTTSFRSFHLYIFRSVLATEIIIFKMRSIIFFYPFWQIWQFTIGLDWCIAEIIVYILPEILAFKNIFNWSWRWKQFVNFFKIEIPERFHIKKYFFIFSNYFLLFQRRHFINAGKIN